MFSMRDSTTPPEEQLRRKVIGSGPSLPKDPLKKKKKTECSSRTAGERQMLYNFPEQTMISFLYTAHAELPNHSKPAELTRLSAAPENKRHGAALCSSALLTGNVQRGVLTWGKLLAFSILGIHTLRTLTLAKHVNELLFLPYSNR